MPEHFQDALTESHAHFSMRLFSTFIYSFAQSSCENFIDAENENIYLAPQIEPEAQRLNGSSQMSRSLNSCRDPE